MLLLTIIFVYPLKSNETIVERKKERMVMVELKNDYRDGCVPLSKRRIRPRRSYPQHAQQTRVKAVCLCLCVASTLTSRSLARFSQSVGP